MSRLKLGVKGSQVQILSARLKWIRLIKAVVAGFSVVDTGVLLSRERKQGSGNERDTNHREYPEHLADN